MPEPDRSGGSGPEPLWVADLKYIPTGEGWLNPGWCRTCGAGACWAGPCGPTPGRSWWWTSWRWRCGGGSLPRAWCTTRTGAASTPACGWGLVCGRQGFARPWGAKETPTTTARNGPPPGSGTGTSPGASAPGCQRTPRTGRCLLTLGMRAPTTLRPGVPCPLRVREEVVDRTRKRGRSTTYRGRGRRLPLRTPFI